MTMTRQDVIVRLKIMKKDIEDLISQLEALGPGKPPPKFQPAPKPKPNPLYRR